MYAISHFNSILASFVLLLGLTPVAINVVSENLAVTLYETLIRAQVHYRYGVLRICSLVGLYTNMLPNLALQRGHRSQVSSPKRER